MATVLVTGGCGFIGTHLVGRLLRQGDRVVSIDSHYTSDPANASLYGSNPNYEFINRDVRYPLSDLGGFDEIYNLACPASPIHYQRDPVMTINTNVMGAIHTLELARRSGAKVFQASTSEVYGDPKVHPQPETYLGNVNSFGPRACYDEGKRCAETIFREYAAQYGVDIRIARIFNTYGPFMHPNDGRVVSNFITQALSGKPISVYGNGEQTRSFCYVTDLVDGILRFMRGPSTFQGPCNLGNPNEVTINQLAEQIGLLTETSVIRVHTARPQDDPMKRRPDITLAQRILDWSPTTALPDGLQETINYFSGMRSPNLAERAA